MVCIARLARLWKNYRDTASVNSCHSGHLRVGKPEVNNLFWGLENPEYNERTLSLRRVLCHKVTTRTTFPLHRPYCSDPNCVYCKQLQQVQQEMRSVA